MENKITLELDQKDWFEFMKFGESVSLAAVSFSYHPYSGQTTFVKILDKDALSEAAHEKIKELEEEVSVLKHEAYVLKEEVRNKEISCKKKKYFWQ